MKFNSRVCFILIFAVLLFFWAIPPAAMADVDVAKARVHRVGVHPTLGLMVQLQDMAPTPLWTGNRIFWLSPDLGNQGYATALTALSMKGTVWVRIAGTGSANSLIKIIYCDAP